MRSWPIWLTWLVTASASTSMDLVVDNTTPTVGPGTPDLATADDTGVSTTDNVTSLTTGLTLSGTLTGNPDPGDYIDVSTNLNNLTVGSTSVFSNSNQWSVDINLNEGTHNLRFSVHDWASNWNLTQRETMTIVVDTTDPTITLVPWT